MRFRLVALALLTSTSALAAPGTLLQQGRVVDALGDPVSGSKTLVFTLHTQLEGGSGAVWTEQDGVVLEDGYYSTTLGDGTSLTALDFAATSYWLEIAEFNGPVFSPRTPLASVPSALSLVGGFRPPPVTTSERDALSVSAGTLVYNTSLNQIQMYNGTSWQGLGADSIAEGYTGRLIGWGRNSAGELGLGDTSQRSFPTALNDFGSPVTEVSAGGYYNGSEGATCVITQAGDLYCSGRGAHVPENPYSNHSSFAQGGHLAQMGVSLTWREVTVGDGLVACAVTTSDDAYCWGLEYYGGTGKGEHGGDYDQTPSLVVGNKQWKMLRPGGRYGGSTHVAVLCGVTTETGQANGYCWGRDDYGQLGNGSGTTHDYTGPSSATLLPSIEWKSITPGYLHVCGIDTNDDAYCWGYNGNGQLGNGTTTNLQSPTLVSGGHQWVELALGSNATCGIRTDGVAMCWGYNQYGRLGDGTTIAHSSPVEVVGGKTWTAITMGELSACALDNHDRLYCWGYNGNGQLGDGTTTQHNAPYLVHGDYTFSHVAMGIRHTVGVAR